MSGRHTGPLSPWVAEEEAHLERLTRLLAAAGPVRVGSPGRTGHVVEATRARHGWHVRRPASAHGRPIATRTSLTGALAVAWGRAWLHGDPTTTRGRHAATAPGGEGPVTTPRPQALTPAHDRTLLAHLGPGPARRPTPGVWLHGHRVGHVCTPAPGGTWHSHATTPGRPEQARLDHPTRHAAVAWVIRHTDPTAWRDLRPAVATIRRDPTHGWVTTLDHTTLAWSPDHATAITLAHHAATQAAGTWWTTEDTP